MDANGVEYNQEAIGRTPIVRVDLMHGENIVTRAFIKLVISVDKAYDNISIMDNQKEFVVKCPDTKETMTYNVEKLRKDLYRVLNISHVDFWNLYDFDKAYVKKDGKDFATFPAPKLVDGIADDGKATKEVYWEFTHGQVGKIGQGAKVEGYLVLKNKLDLYSKYPTTVTFKFTADFRLPKVGKEIKVTADIKDIFWKTSGDNSVLQANVNVPASETDVAANCYFQTPIAEQPWDKLSVTGLPCGEIPMFRIAKVYMDGKEYKAPVSGIYLAPSTVAGEENISLYKDKSVMKALNSELGLQALIEWYAVGKSGDEYVLHTFMVNFIRPVNLNFPDDIHVRMPRPAVTRSHTALQVSLRIGEARLSFLQLLLRSTRRATIGIRFAHLLTTPLQSLVTRRLKRKATTSSSSRIRRLSFLWLPLSIRLQLRFTITPTFRHGTLLMGIVIATIIGLQQEL